MKYRTATRASDGVLAGRSNLKGKCHVRDLGVDERIELNEPYRNRGWT
jgi:hypothetical protein